MSKSKLRKVISISLAMALLSFLWVGVAQATDPIVLDSVFTDWAGEQNITDPTGETKEWEDITQFWWADNEGESYAYWRVDRVSGTEKEVTYIVYVDTNNNGIFTENVDREVVVDYRPENTWSEVDITVRYADTDIEISSIVDQDWGESIAEGAAKVEFRASFADLGIGVGQTIRMYTESFKYRKTNLKDRAPDSGDIQWSPVDILGYPLLAAVVVMGVGAIWYFRGRRVWKATS